jgi:hypothetical protein
LPGIDADIVDEEGQPVTRPDAGGYLVIRKPWPAMLRTIRGDHQRYVDTYWSKFGRRLYVAGDSAHRGEDGYYWIMGRIDDVLNVAGHRLGTMEIESALVSHPRVAEAAVVGRPHEIKGESVFAYVVCRGQRPGTEAGALVRELRTHVSEQLGAIAKPDDIRFADALPKTRSGKIMRRLLRAVARGEPITQDVSTLENPAIIDQLRGIDAEPTVAMPQLDPTATVVMPKGTVETVIMRRPGMAPPTRERTTGGARRTPRKAAGRKPARARKPNVKRAASRKVVSKPRPKAKRLARRVRVRTSGKRRRTR